MTKVYPFRTIAVFQFSLLAAALWLAGCSSDAKPSVENAAPAEALAVPERPIFDIPKLTGITIDGDPSGWGDRGFAVAVMHAAQAKRLPADRFDAQVRLGWDPRGLLVLADVTDPDVMESDTDLDLGSGASVELVVDARHGKEHWQASIAPGFDPHHRQLRTHLTEERLKPTRAVPLSVEAVAKKTPRGYVLEAMMPWAVLAVDAKNGTEVGLQVRVNKPVDSQMAQLVFSPRQIRLADVASVTQTVAADGSYDRFTHLRLSIAATADAAGKTVEFKSGQSVLGQTTLTAGGRVAVAVITLPMPRIPTSVPVVAWLDGQPIGTVSLPNIGDLRKEEASELDVVAQKSVFNTRTFPRIDFYSPTAADDVLGDYTIRTTYYDADYNAVTTADRPGRYGAIAEITPEFGEPFKRYLTLFHAGSDFTVSPLNLKATIDLPAKLGVDPVVAKEQASAAGDFFADELRISRWRDQDAALYLAGLSEIAPGEGNLPRRLGIEGKDTAWWYGLQKQTGNLVPYRYLVHLPKPGAGGATAKIPLMLFLHGSGQRGHNLEAVKENGPPKLLRDEPAWPFKDSFIIVSPQCPVGQSWNPLLLRDLLDEVMAKYPVDPDRVYLTGLSMGGFGTWELAEWFPERFAAIVPICGGGDPADVARLKEIPTWVFHGGRDPAVPIENSYQMVQAMRDLHARIRFTVYPGYSHNSWEPAYDDPRLYEWMLAQRRGQPVQAPAVTADTRPAED
jgi:pimeloyl-ACP methyl ester carboxylesterase